MQCPHPPKDPPLSSCVGSLSLLRRRAILRIYCTHGWKPCPSSAQPPIHLKPLGPHQGDTVAPEHLGSSYWHPNEGGHPLVLRKGGKKTTSYPGSPRKHLVCEESRGTHSIVPHSPATFSWCLGSLFHRDYSNFMLCMCVPANWSPKTGCAVPKGQEKITPGAFIPEALVGALF